MRVFIGKDYLVHGALREGFVEVLGGGEVTAVEVALAHGEHVKQDEDTDSHGGQKTPSNAGKLFCVSRLALW